MKRVLLMTVGGLILATTAMAGMENTRFALHWKTEFVATKTIPNLCDVPSTVTEEANYSPNYTNTPCTQYTTAGPLGSNLIGATVYMVLAKAGPEGVAAASFGIDYAGSDGVGIDPRYVTWTPCADGLSFPNDGGNGEFPKPKGGLRLTWTLPNSCQLEQIPPDGTHAVVGSFYVYAYSAAGLQVTPNNNLQGGIPELAVTACNGITTDLYATWGGAIASMLVGRVDFGGGAGYNPCFVTPTAPSTWGKIKTKYNN